MPARTGSFTGGTFAYGQDLSVVHPPNNDVTSGRYFEGLLAEPGLSADERDELQREFEELLAAMTLYRDFYGSG